MLTVTPSLLENHAGHGDDRACMTIRSLVSGLPRLERERRILVTVQVAIDDSNRGQEDAPAFILAGFIATVPRWTDFADAWQDELEREPKIIGPLKASEAINLKKNFAGWTDHERDERLLSFVKLIQGHAFASVRTSLVKRDFDRILSKFGGALRKLYAEASMAIITRTMHFAESRKMRQSFEYIFDVGILSPNQLADMHKDALKWLPQKARLIGKFRHDTDDNFYPLQAADLFAGYFREWLVANSEGRTFKSPVLDALMAIYSIDAQVTERHLRYIADKVTRRSL
jgi:hypothetical protein